MVEIFKTNVSTIEQSIKLSSIIQADFPELIVNFDLEDCDKVFRVEGINIPIKSIKKRLRLEGYLCEVLF